MPNRLLVGILSLVVVAGCSAQQSVTVVEQLEITPTTTTTTHAPPPQIVAPAGLVQSVIMSVTVEALDLDERMVASNDGAVGIFSPIATCSLGEGGGWFPLEIVASGESFFRLNSAAPISDGFTAIDGQLHYHSSNIASVEADVTVYVDDDRASGSFVGNDHQGHTVSGEFECVSSIDETMMTVDVDTELSVRLAKSDGVGGRLVRRLGLRTSSEQMCLTTVDGTSDRWFVENADQPVGGLTGVALTFTPSTGSWAGEFKIVEQSVVIEALSVSEMPTGLVFSGVSVEGYSVDGALTC